MCFTLCIQLTKIIATFSCFLNRKFTSKFEDKGDTKRNTIEQFLTILQRSFSSTKKKRAEKISNTYRSFLFPGNLWKFSFSCDIFQTQLVHLKAKFYIANCLNQIQKGLTDWVIDFSGISTLLQLYYIKRLEYHVLFMFILKFLAASK